MRNHFTTISTITRLGLLLAFVVLWLIPFFWTGRMGRFPWKLPPRLHTQYACAGLFTKRTWNWNQPLIQVRRGDTESWETLDMTELSPLGAYGYRQRLHRLLLKTAGSKVRDSIRRRLALWVALHDQEAHPDQGAVMAVRYAQNVWPVNCPELVEPTGKWEVNPASLGPTGRFQVLATFALGNGAAKLLPTSRDPKPLPTPAAFSRQPRPKGPNP